MCVKSFSLEAIQTLLSAPTLMTQVEVATDAIAAEIMTPKAIRSQIAATYVTKAAYNL